MPGLPGLARSETPPPPPTPAKIAAADQPANAGFESLGTDGLPIGWTAVGQPIVEMDGANHYVHANRNNYLRQFAAPTFVRRHRTLSVLVRGELGVEGLWLRQSQGAPTRSTFPQSRIFLDGAGWQRIYATLPILHDTTTMSADFFGADSVQWLDVDDVAFLDEGIANGRLELAVDPAMLSAWQFAGGAAIIADSTLDAGGASALQLPAGASASQLVGAAFDGQEYFLAGAARADSAPGTLAAGETWRDGRGAALGSASESFGIASSATDFLLRSGNFSGTHVSTVEFVNTGASALVLDKLGRGLTRVFPGTYAPGPGAVRPLLELTAAWPDYLASATVEIRRADSLALVATIPLALSGGTAFAEWDGASAAPGECIARFLLGDGAAGTLQIDRTFTIATGPESASPQPLAGTGIARGAWIWLFNDGDSAAELRPIFEQAQADGFTFAVVFGRASQWPAVQAVCEEIGYPFMLGDSTVMAAIRRQPGFADFDRASFVQTVETSIGGSFPSPQCLGFYLVDEPEIADDIQRAAWAVQVAANEPGWKPPFLTISGIPGFNTRFQTIQSPVYWTDSYPITSSTAGDAVSALRALADHVESTVATANSLGREYWLVAEAFTDLATFRYGGASVTRATIGVLLALGGKGYVPFFYRQINSLEGIRTFELGELPETAAWVETNARVAAGESELAALTNHARLGAATGPVLATTAAAPGGEAVLFLVNLEARRRTEIDVSFDAAPTLTELTTGQTLSAPAGTLTLLLEPGDWRALRLSAGNVNGVSAAALEREERFVSPPVALDLTLDTGAIRDLAFDSTGTRILATGANRAIVLNTAGSELARPTLRDGRRGRFAPDGTMLVSDFDQGLVALEPTGSLLDGHLRRTGSSTAALAAAENAWNAMAYYGIRRLSVAGAGSFAPLDFATTDDFVTGIVGPFANEGVLYFELDGGVRRAVPVAASGVATDLQWSSSRLVQGALSPSGTRLAVARLRRGFALLSLDAGGAALDAREHAGDAFVAESIAWVREDLLAVADAAGDVVLYAVAPDLHASDVARWRDDTALGTIASVAAADEQLAVGYADGRLVLLDFAGITLSSSASPAWMRLR